MDDGLHGEDLVRDAFRGEREGEQTHGVLAGINTDDVGTSNRKRGNRVKGGAYKDSREEKKGF